VPKMSPMASSSARSIGRIVPKSSALFLCDMQEKFRPSIAHFDKIVYNSNRVLNAAKIMEMPVMATEQYPKGLGRTVPEIELAKFGIVPFEKTCFTMAIPELMAKLAEEQGGPTESVILCGIETQACIYHTVMDLLERGDINVHVVADCCSSRSETDRMITLQRLRDMGAFLTTTETVILGFAADAKHPKFKGLQKLCMEVGPDTGLLK